MAINLSSSVHSLLLNNSKKNNKYLSLKVPKCTCLCIDPSGLYLFCIKTDGLVYSIDKNTFLMTRYANTIGDNGYGGLYNIFLTNNNIVYLGGFSSINGVAVSGIAYQSIITSTIIPAFTLPSDYRARWITKGISIKNNTNDIYLTGVSFAVIPTNTYMINYYSGVAMTSEKFISPTATNLKATFTYNSNNYYTYSTSYTHCSDPSWVNIYTFANTSILGDDKYNDSILKYNKLTNVFSLFIYLGKGWNMTSSDKNGINPMVCSDTYLYQGLFTSMSHTTTSNPSSNLLSTDGTNSICNYIFRINTSGTPIIYSLGTGLNNYPNHMAYDNIRKYIYVVGAFTTAGDISVGYCAYWDENTSTWNRIVTLNNIAINVVYLNNVLYISGNFTRVNDYVATGFVAVSVPSFDII